MNPLTNVKNITKLNEREIALGTKGSWHDQYKDSAWVFIGGLPYDLTEGDIICVFSQFGEIVNVNLIRDKKSGKSKGFCFMCYENQKSTVLAVDNLNGIKIVGRTIRVDHVANYKPPKEREDDDEITKSLYLEGCAPKVPVESPKQEQKKKKKDNKKKKSKDRKKKKKRRQSTSNSSSDSSSEEEKLDVKIKEEKHDPDYDKYDERTTVNVHRNKVIGPIRAPTIVGNGNAPDDHISRIRQRDSFEPRDRNKSYTNREWQNDRQFRRNQSSRDRSLEMKDVNNRGQIRDVRKQNSRERSAERNRNTRDQSREISLSLTTHSDHRPQCYRDRSKDRNSRDRSRERRHNDNGRRNFKDNVYGRR